MSPQQGPSSGASQAWQEAKEPRERAQSGADRAKRKRRAESPGGVSGTKAEAAAESGAGPFPSPALPIALARLREIEAELICADEADAELEPGESEVPAEPPAAAQPPAAAAGRSLGHGLGLGAGAALRAALRQGSARYKHKDFAAAAAEFCAALQLCSKGFATEDPLKSSPDEISRLASWIESKLVICYLKLEQPGLALSHSHRSIIQNPSHFCHHLRQAACFRGLRRYSEAARSAMAAQCLYVLSEGAGLDTSDLLQLYWQAMIQEALSGEKSFSVLYTPFEKEDKADKIKEANKTFAEKHPDYVQHIFTDPHGIHLLPERAESHPDQQYLLTLGFRNREIGKAVEKSVTRKLPTFPGQKRAFSACVEERTGTFWQNTGERIMAVMAFIGSTKIKNGHSFLAPWLTISTKSDLHIDATVSMQFFNYSPEERNDERGPCARAIEHFHHASLLGHLQGGEQQAQVVAQAMAELATVPCLQRVSQEEDKLLQSLMADAIDILAGRTGEHAWTKIQKVALIEEYLREGEERYLRAPWVHRPGMEIPWWTPWGQGYLRLENTHVFIPNPRSLATGLKKRCLVFANS